MPYSASIVQRQFIDIPDNVLSLSGAALLRKLPTSWLWDRIRIGLICAVTPNGVNNIQDANFTLGICSGQTYPGASFNTINYVGASIIGTQAVGATRLLTYNAGGPYYGATAGAFFVKLEGAVTSATTFSTAASLALVQTGRYQRRTVFVLDILKTQGGTGALTLTLYGPSAAMAQTIDFRPDDLQGALDCITTPTIRDQTLTALDTKATLNYSPLLGDVDTLEIYWGNTTFPLEISAVGAVILAPSYYLISTGSAASAPGTAIEPFDEYTASAGSIAESTFLTGGSGWTAAGSVAYDQVSYNSGASANSSNLAPQVYTQYVGTTNSPSEGFEQYATGTVDSGTTISLGTFWSAPAAVMSDGFSLSIIHVYSQMAGTEYNDYDTFQTYGTNDQSNPYITNPAGGAVWNGQGTIYSTGPSLFVGTVSANLAPFAGSASLAGTQYGVYDTFESYGTGTVVSGVTINAGSYWSANGKVTTFSYP